MRETFAKWFRKAHVALFDNVWQGVGSEKSPKISPQQLEANRKHWMETRAWAARPKVVIDPVWVDPMKADYGSEGIGSLATLWRTEENPIVQTAAEKAAWVHEYDSQVADWQRDFQNKINAAFAKPLMTAIMWALEGEMAKVSGGAQVETASWMETTCEIALSDLAFV